MSSTSSAASLGPKQLRPASGEGFVLGGDVFAVQTYVDYAHALPTNREELEHAVECQEDDAIAPFTFVTAALAPVQSGSASLAQLVADTHGLASDIYAYAQQAASYFGTLQPYLEKLGSNPTDASARTMLAEAVQRLRGDADERRKKAAAVQARWQAAHDDVVGQQETLSGLTGRVAGVVRAQGLDAEGFAQQLASWTKQLNTYNAQYAHDRAKALQALSYSWLGPIGLIAGAVEAGKYGSKAKSDKQAMDLALKNINQLKNEARVARLAQTFAGALEGLTTDASARCAGVVASTGSATLAWESVVEDLHHVESTAGRVGADDAFMGKLDVEEAIQQWREVGDLANAYRLLKREVSGTPPVRR